MAITLASLHTLAESGMAALDSGDIARAKLIYAKIGFALTVTFDAKRGDTEYRQAAAAYDRLGAAIKEYEAELKTGGGQIQRQTITYIGPEGDHE